MQDKKIIASLNKKQSIPAPTIHPNKRKNSPWGRREFLHVSLSVQRSFSALPISLLPPMLA